MSISVDPYVGDLKNGGLKDTCARVDLFRHRGLVDRLQIVNMEKGSRKSRLKTQAQKTTRKRENRSS